MVCSQEVSFDQDWSWNHFHLVGRRNMSFGRASKYVIWSGDEICHLVRRLKQVIWSVVEIYHLVGNEYLQFGRASKYVIWSAVKNCEQVWSWNQFHLVGRRNMSFGRASKYVIWQGSKTYYLVICHLVGRRNMSFGR